VARRRGRLRRGRSRATVWRIGVLMPGNENDPVQKPRLSAFTQALADLGWTDGRNVRMDLRWHGDDTNRIRALAKELVGLQSDIIVASGTPATVAVAAPIQQHIEPLLSAPSSPLR
jgi:ABC-type uncharacterized transport system substrate-binding protein